MRREGASWDPPSRTLSLKQTRRHERSVPSTNLKDSCFRFVREILGTQSVMDRESASGSCNSGPAAFRYILYKGAAARVQGWTEILGFPCTGGSKGANPDRRGYKFQLGGPSLHIIRPRTERHSSLDFPASGWLPLRIKHGHPASKRTDPKPRADICMYATR